VCLESSLVVYIYISHGASQYIEHQSILTLQTRITAKIREGLVSSRTSISDYSQLFPNKLG